MSIPCRNREFQGPVFVGAMVAIIALVVGLLVESHTLTLKSATTTATNLAEVIRTNMETTLARAEGDIHSFAQLLRGEDLSAQLIPQAGLPHTLSHEIDVLFDGTPALRGELTEYPVRLQPRRCGLDSDHRVVRTPGPRAGLAHHARSHRIQHDIARQLQQVTVFFDEDCFAPKIGSGLAIMHFPSTSSY